MEIADEIYQLAQELGVKNVTLPKIEVGNGVLAAILPFVLENDYKHIILVVDDNTYVAAGKQIEKMLVEAGMETKTVLLKANRHQQVIADEATIVELLVETPLETDIYIAVGSGTIHDITRFCGSKMNIPFISVPTAASVDGFTSKGSPLILRGVKQTIQTTFPVAVFADITILKAAPQEMTAAGFGDILAKYTSLLDWKISACIGGEPYNRFAAEMTRKSLEACVQNVSKIAKADDEGVTILIHSLIESGLVMLLLDFSRPASGGEHHLSHYWEMDLLKKDAKQLLHGAKVGVATAIIVDLYKQKLKDLPARDTGEYGGRIRGNWQSIMEILDNIPSPKEIRNLIQKTGGPTTTEELGLDDELVAQSINEAFHLRDRCTGLLLINKFKEKDLTYPL
ncbi:sn-glycerol-1-phosphate dehydrogenase [Oceanobacillus bengalensis]|uniref:sn-glycerol-1-phosphate dehydrogenase n=1 Tax=Oceanobacillus bengalensis TaxID=1435466 RepID=A0A494Z071_9BACI|nr:sn-glycerol-1-phosphate dehydrogenase [Oceanobacillus bengalensis]RKQ15675.1 sn-glycerol-1-phosphate dehydrogenase [Oceanobacillus bengalensis]